MKKTNLICGIFSALLLVSPLVSADSEYPAYDFEPTIVYQDESVIAQIEAAKTQAATESAPTENGAAAVAGDGAAEASADDSTLLIGILALAGILFVAYKKSADAGKPKGPAASASTGVSRYLDKHAQAGAAVSGVEKYLQERG